MRSLKRLILSVLLLCAAAGSSLAAPDYGRQLFDVFLRKMNPEKAHLQLVEQPREDGYISWGYIECQNANISGLNVQSMRMDCFDARVTPPSEWEKMDHPIVQSMLSCHAEGTFTEKDVNDFLRNRMFGHENEWDGLHIRITNGRIKASGYYRVNLKLFRMRIRFDVSCRISGRGTAIYLEDIELKINNQEVSPGLVESAIKKIQPIFNLKKYNLPLYLSKVEFGEGFCHVRSRILPKPITMGTQWNYPEETQSDIKKSNSENS